MRYYYVPGSAAAHDQAAAALAAGTLGSRPTAAYVILRAAQPYDLATPGTPSGILAVARAADAGALLPAPGGWRYTAAFALAAPADGPSGAVVASLALRLAGDLPGRGRRAWVVYVRRAGEDGTVQWRPAGAGLLDAGDAARPLRPIGIEELKATLRGEVWTPPPPRPGPPRLRCFTCDKVTPFSTTTWRPYTRHRCDVGGQEGRS